MKNNIIDTAIDSLRTEGLKFSVDTIASKLKISKKTIYKYFSDKESLAYAIYEKYYADASDKIKEIEQNGVNIKYRLLIMYYDSVFMIRREIFNKYKLNNSVYSYAVKRQDELWRKILPVIAPSVRQEDETVLRAIIEGAFEKSAAYSVSAEKVAERLVTLL